MTKAKAQLLVQALKKRFGGQAESEAVNNRGRYRFAVTSSEFETMPQLARQDEVWKIADRVLTPADTLDISMILAFSPADLSISGK